MKFKKGDKVICFNPTAMVGTDRLNGRTFGTIIKFDDDRNTYTIDVTKCETGVKSARWSEKYITLESKLSRIL